MWQSCLFLRPWPVVAAAVRRWRPGASLVLLVRLQAALPALAAGEPLHRVSRGVGYGTVSAFVAAFRRETGTTPGAYFGARR
ncbi:helix-turn-helix domain-containing protein [Streptomyces sp. NPDC059616]|uniref:helix-turn-helix domain-containing protein n=1 Tax=unclassified Streptomyces TaxID=2593676 RepID=UPI00362B4A88